MVERDYPLARLLAPERLIGRPATDVVRMIFQTSPWIVTGYLYPYRYIKGTPTRKPFGRDYLNHTFIREELIFLEGKVESLLQPGFDVGIASIVDVAFLHKGDNQCREVMHTDEMHIPMIDFESTVTPENLLKIMSRLSKFDIGDGKATWVILDSGNSYQAYALDYLLGRPLGKNAEEVIDLFAEQCHKALDFDTGQHHDPIVSSWYFAHSARQGCMVLRLTHNRPELKKQVPVVVGWVFGGMFRFRQPFDYGRYWDFEKEGMVMIAREWDIRGKTVSK